MWIIKNRNALIVIILTPEVRKKWQHIKDQKQKKIGHNETQADPD